MANNPNIIPRAHTADLREKLLHSTKIILLFGPRQVGKTTLIRSILAGLPVRYLEINADQSKYIDILSSRDLLKMRGLVEGYDLLFIDEAQRIPEIGINLKILHDALPRAAALAIEGAYIEHHFAQSIEGIEDKQDFYSLLYAVRLAAGGKRSRPTLGLRGTHVLRDAVIKGALFRGGLPALRLAWAVSKTHARKYEIIREIERGEHADLLALFRAERFEELFKTALARFGA